MSWLNSVGFGSSFAVGNMVLNPLSLFIGLNIIMFRQIPNGVFHSSDVLVVYVYLWEGGFVSKLTHKVFGCKVFSKMECLITDVVFVHKLSKFRTETATVFRVNVELGLAHMKKER